MERNTINTFKKANEQMIKTAKTAYNIEEIMYDAPSRRKTTREEGGGQGNSISDPTGELALDGRRLALSSEHSRTLMLIQKFHIELEEAEKRLERALRDWDGE